jgi:hypothetical protein
MQEVFIIFKIGLSAAFYSIKKGSLYAREPF